MSARLRPPSRIPTQAALEELRQAGVIDGSYTLCDPLDGGTTNTVLGLGKGTEPELVLKVDRPANTWATARFLDAYAGRRLVSRVRYVDPEYRFLLYEYEAGELTRQSEEPVDKAGTLLTLTRELLSHYVAVDAPMACWFDELYGPPETWCRDRTWQGYLSMVLYHRHAAARPLLPAGAEALVSGLAAAPQRRGDGPLRLQHGDCGAHNFVFRDGQLAVVIDPRPAAGEPIWDLASAFASWPSELTLDAVLPAAEALESAGCWQPAPWERRRLLVEEVVIALYSWTALCAWYIPQEVPAYLRAWEEWTELLRREQQGTRALPGSGAAK